MLAPRSSSVCQCLSGALFVMASFAAWLESLALLGRAGLDRVDHACAVLASMPQRTTLVTYIDELSRRGGLLQVSHPEVVVGHALAAACSAGLLQGLGPLGAQHAVDCPQQFVDFLATGRWERRCVDIPLDLRAVEAVDLAMPGFSRWRVQTLVDRGASGFAASCGATEERHRSRSRSGARSRSTVSLGETAAATDAHMEAHLEQALQAGVGTMLSEARSRKASGEDSTRKTRPRSSILEDEDWSAPPHDPRREREATEKTGGAAGGNSLSTSAAQAPEDALCPQQRLKQQRLEQHLHAGLVALLPDALVESLCRFCPDAMLEMLQERMEQWRDSPMDKCRAELMREVAMASEAGKGAVARRAGVGAAPRDFEEMLACAAAGGS